MLFRSEALALGSTDSLDARRAWAAGQLGRQHLDLPVAALGAAPAAAPAADSGPERETILYVHLAADVAGGIGPIATLEARRAPVLLEVVKGWCAESSRVTIRPVLELATERHCESYEAAPVLRELVIVRDRTCVFPFCRRPARRADLDHVRPYAGGGSTEASNLACLCRHHHRSKTHAGWRYRPDPDHPGDHLWTKIGRAHV